MSTRRIETGVVALEFDPQAFERGIQSSLNGLAALKSAMNMDSAARSFSVIEEAANNIQLGSMASGIDTIADRFSTMGLIGMTVITNITNAITDSLTSAVKTFANIAFWEPMTQGYQEYEMQIGAVQTILANTRRFGTSLDDVMVALGELNDFSDKTIYNFAQMVTSIGAFTTAGVELGTSVDAIKGISGLAAISGATSEKMANAMYMMSQAINSGYLMTRHWNSLTTAGMGGQIFQDELINTARVHGIAIDNMIRKRGSFRETLQERWLTSDILLETLAKFSGDVSEDQLRAIGYTEEAIDKIMELGDQSMAAATNIKTFSQFQTVLRESIATGWTSTAVALVGDFEQSVDMYTRINASLSAVIAASAKSRNDRLEFFSFAGGREHLINALIVSIENVINISGLAREALNDIFPAIRKGQLIKGARQIEALAISLKMGEETGRHFQNVVRGIAAALDIVKMLAFAVAKPFWEMFKTILGGSGTVLALLGHFGNLVVGVRNGIKAAGTFTIAVDKVIDILKIAGRFIAGLVREFATLDVVQDILEHFRGLGGFDLKGILDGLRMVVFGVAEGFRTFYRWLSQIEQLRPLFEFLESLTWNNIKSFLNEAYARLPELVAEFWRLHGIVYKFVNDIIARYMPTAVYWFYRTKLALLEFLVVVRDFRDKVLDSEFVSKMRTWIESFDGSRLIAFKDSLLEFISGIRELVREASGNALEKVFSYVSIPDTDAILETLSTLFTNVSNFISENDISIDWDRFFDLIKLGLAAWVAKETVGIAKSIQQFFRNVLTGGWFKTIFGGWLGEAAKLRESITKVFMGLETTMVSMQNNLKADTLLKIAGAIGVMVLSLVVLSTLDNEKLGRGIASMAFLGAQLVAVVGVLMKMPTVTLYKATGALVAMAAAMLVMSLAVTVLSRTDPETLATGLIAIGASLAVMIPVSKGLGLYAPGTIRAAISIGILGVSLLVLSKAIKVYGDIDVDTLIIGLGSIGAALLIFGEFSRLVNGRRLIAGSVGVAAMGGALMVMSIAIAEMGTLEWEELVRGLAGIAGILAIVAAASYGMKGAIPGAIAMVIVSGALYIMAQAISVISLLTWDQLAVVLATLAGSFIILGLASLVLSPAVPIIVGIGAGLALMGVGALAAGGGLALVVLSALALAAGAPILLQGIELLAHGLIRLSPLLGVAMVAALLGMAEGLSEAAPRLYAAFANLFVGFLAVVATTTPQIADLVLTMLLDLLKIVDDKLPQFIEVGHSIIISWLQGMEQNAGKVTTQALKTLLAYLRALAGNLRPVVKAGVDVMLAWLKGMEEKLPDLTDAAWEFIIAWIESMSESLDENFPAFLDAVYALGESVNAALIAALVAGVENVAAAAMNLGRAILDGISSALRPGSPSRETRILADQAVDGVLAPAISRVNEVKRRYTNLIEAAKDGMNEALRTMSTGGLEEDIFNPRITPILDLGGMRGGLRELNRAFDNPRLSAISAFDAEEDEPVEDSRGGPDDRPGVIFNQYNTSPKALSTSEVYRRTKSLLGKTRTNRSEEF